MSGIVFLLHFVSLVVLGVILVETIKSKSFNLELKMALVAMLVVIMGILLINAYFGIVRGDLLFQQTLRGSRG